MELSEYKNQLWKVSLRGLRGLARLLLRLEMGQKKSVPKSQEGKYGCRAGMEGSHFLLLQTSVSLCASSLTTSATPKRFHQRQQGKKVALPCILL